MKSFFLDLFFPKSCLNCGREGEFICPDCLELIPINEKISKGYSLAKLIIATNYNHPLVKKTIHLFKYEFVKELAEPLSQLMIKKLTTLDFKNDLILIPVPLHQKRLRWRGFNQSELLAEKISKQLDIPLANILFKKRNIKPQAKILSRTEREDNIKEAFDLKEELCLKNKTAILVDDVSTTGATLEECAKILKKTKAKEIWGLVLAKG